MDRFLVESYFGWLQAECFTTKQEMAQYTGVIRELHDIPFYWTIVLDDNRSGDALDFRQFEFLDRLNGIQDIDPNLLAQWAAAAPSVLEVMLGISRRWAYYFGGPSVAFYFNHLFKNMGFDQFVGRSLGPERAAQLRDRVDVWLSRQFYPNGIGSPFPINQGFTCVDMRNVDIWGQMNAYSAEHFQ